jgi:aspartokinase
MLPEQYMDAVKASGEDNNAKLIAAYFRRQGVKAEYVNRSLRILSIIEKSRFSSRAMAAYRSMTVSASSGAADPARKAVVVSAPGKRFSDDTKVTDLLIRCAEHYGISRHDLKHFLKLGS